MERENKDVIRRIFGEMINGKRLGLADELYSATHELHPAAAGVSPGPEGMRDAFAGLHEEYPDVHVEVHSIVAEGDLVAVRVTFRGTHAATGEVHVWPEMVITRFADGKAAESWEITDTGRAPDAPPW